MNNVFDNCINKVSKWSGRFLKWTGVVGAFMIAWTGNISKLDSIRRSRKRFKFWNRKYCVLLSRIMETLLYCFYWVVCQLYIYMNVRQHTFKNKLVILPRENYVFFFNKHSRYNSRLSLILTGSVFWNHLNLDCFSLIIRNLFEDYLAIVSLISKFYASVTEHSKNLFLFLMILMIAFLEFNKRRWNIFFNVLLVFVRGPETL